MKRPWLILVLTLWAAAPVIAADPPPSVEGDFVLRDFRFTTGETLPELRLHYLTIGTMQRDAAGVVRNAVLLLHGTTGRGAVFLTDTFAGQLFGPDQPLDARRYYIILPDNIGHGRSSKPSDGLRARFPRYTYDDMVLTQYRLVTEGLGVDHLRLIVGTSMGGMHAWLWAGRYPEFMDAVLPLVCLPAQIAGRNRVQRRLVSDAIRGDPGWNNGEYARPPRGLVSALQMALIAASSAAQLSRQWPTTEATDRMLDGFVQQRLPQTDANDFLYAWESSRGYDPGPGLERIQAWVYAVNFEDDEINPPELRILERETQRVRRGRAVVVPASERTRGHLSYWDAGLWLPYLVELLRGSER